MTSAKKKADQAFSLYIRTRDSVNGICTCATCGAKVPIKSAHAGHFMSRKHLATRYHEWNVNAQCFACNIHRGGEQYLHSLYIDQKHCQNASLELYFEAQKIKQMKVQDYLDIAETYKQKLSELISLDKKE